MVVNAVIMLQVASRKFVYCCYFILFVYFLYVYTYQYEKFFALFKKKNRKNCSIHRIKGNWIGTRNVNDQVPIGRCDGICSSLLTTAKQSKKKTKAHADVNDDEIN